MSDVVDRSRRRVAVLRGGVTVVAALLGLVPLVARADDPPGPMVLVREEVPWTTTTLALPRGEVPTAALAPLARALEASPSARSLVEAGGGVRVAAVEDGLVVVIEAPPEEQARAAATLTALLAAPPAAATGPLVDDARRGRVALHRAVFGDRAPLAVLLDAGGNGAKPDLAAALRALAGGAGRLVVQEGRVDAPQAAAAPPAFTRAAAPTLPAPRTEGAALVVDAKATTTVVLVGHALRPQAALLGAAGAGLTLYVREALSGFGDVEAGVDVSGGAALWWARVPTGGKAPAIVFEDARAALARAAFDPARFDELARQATATTLRDRARVGAAGMEAARRRLSFGDAASANPPLDGAALRALCEASVFPSALRGVAR